MNRGVRQSIEVVSESASQVAGYEKLTMENTVSTEDLKRKVDGKRTVVVETLAPERFREGHIPGALNMPPERVAELAPQLLPRKDAEIVTYCANTH